MTRTTEYKIELVVTLTDRLVIRFIEVQYQSGKQPRRFEAEQVDWSPAAHEKLVEWLLEWSTTHKVPSAARAILS